MATRAAPRDRARAAFPSSDSRRLFFAIATTLLTFSSLFLFFRFRPRSKHKAVHKTTPNDDKRLDNTVKRLGVQQIPGIEEVNIFQ